MPRAYHSTFDVFRCAYNNDWPKSRNKKTGQQKFYIGERRYYGVVEHVGDGKWHVVRSGEVASCIEDSHFR